ncbi:MAG TPA: thioredoxin domain-containing protein [Gemmataceae bacterium]|nr:thioredoxin domain-containing protein [Gemmataceae bacterium]
MNQPAGSANSLLHETSPYLRQHAHNPVDWYPWGPAALERARQLERPIFLSIGYSACHWCHVMEHESFEDPEIARILNEHFVSIKVDREERPDLDQIYMAAVQLLNQGQGGWPMSVFLTPDLKPFFAGTYFPPQDHYGRPGFKRLIEALADAWKNRRDELVESAGQITAHLRVDIPQTRERDLTPALLSNAVAMLRRAFDPTYGGFGSAPKFPHAMDLRLLLRAWKRFGDDHALEMARLTLDRMAMGGMYDQLGGGFHRYSTDERWLVPHFEKMLYDNALLSVAYLEAYQATSEPFYRRIVEETLEYVLREMTSPEGPFYSTQDADSEGEEGKFYVWSATEIEQVLGKEALDVFGYVYDVSPEGNWEGHNILNRSKSDQQDARMLRIDEVELRSILEKAKGKLYEVRSRRVWPGRDEKTLTAWNALMIAAFAQAGAVLEKPEYVNAAVRAAEFLLDRMRTRDGRLLRTYSAGAEPKLNGYLEDYAFLIDALISLYEATFVPRWLDAALQLTDVMIDQFWDATEGGFFFTGKDHEQLIARLKETHDSSTPSGNSMAVTALLRLAKLTGRRDLQEKAEATLQVYRGLLEASPIAMGQMLLALDFYFGPVQEFAVVGNQAETDTQRVLRALRREFRPNKVIALKNGNEPDGLVPLLKGKMQKGPVTTYCCENFTCQAPLIGAEAVEAALGVDRDHSSPQTSPSTSSAT